MSKGDFRRRKEALVVLVGALLTEGLEEDAQKWFRYKDDGSAQVDNGSST